MEDYFSIDDILSAEPRLYVTFHTAGHHLGHLDQVGVAAAAAADSSLDARHLPNGHRLAVPFWLAESLAERSLIALHLPHCFGRSTRAALRADAPSVGLHALCADYFALGVRVARLVRDARLAPALLRAYAARCWRVVDDAVWRGSRGVDAVIKLDRLERSLFFAAHGVSTALVRCKERVVDKIVQFPSVLGKRPRASDSSSVGSPVTPTATRVRVS